MKVRVNSLYRYNPGMWDLFRPCTGNNLKLGQVVKVINLPMAPKANTMGQCYVANPIDGKFICMVSTHSLEPLTDPQKGLFKSLSRKRINQAGLSAIGRYPDNAPIFVSENEASVDPIINGVL